MSSAPPALLVGNQIVVPTQQAGKLPPAPDSLHRAVHQIRLPALTHNYGCVESAATKQRCSVIVVVKADGYGHGAIATALHLADYARADAFAVATLEEGIALRKAFEATPPGQRPAPNVGNSGTSTTASFFVPPDASSLTPFVGSAYEITSQSSNSLASSSFSPPTPCLRPPQIRILVLGPPVGFPRCFDDYYHHNIEVMCSGPEVANAIMEWVADATERRRTEVLRAANDSKAKAILTAGKKPDFPASTNGKQSDNGAKNIPNNNTRNPAPERPLSEMKVPVHPSATLGNVSGELLAKEVRALLISQQAAKDAQKLQRTAPSGEGRSVAAPPSTATTQMTNQSGSTGLSIHELYRPQEQQQQPQPQQQRTQQTQQVFGGIEAAAKNSRTREMAAARVTGIFREDEDEEEQAQPSSHGSMTNGLEKADNSRKPSVNRKRLRWHALVDSGMGRLGFKTQPIEKGDVGVRRDTVEIIQEMIDSEVSGAPIEFYGMVTHMADASSTSNYTTEQINRFKSLLKRVRAAGISVPSVSTDNSAALLTTTLTHFDPKELLSQPNVPTRGFVRTGGAIYGQRPTFKQLRAVSTLLASVRHVAVLKKGESVGYDRAYIAPMNVRIATLTIGFADGYPRDLGNGVGKVAIRGSVFPVAGNVCMDMLMVELGPAEDKGGVGAQVVVGDTAVLWGPYETSDSQGVVRLQDIAGILKTTARQGRLGRLDIAGILKTTQSALTCGLDTVRVRREYVFD